MPGYSQFAAVNPDISLAAVHDRMVVFAQDEAGKLVHVDAARRGKACKCRCLACGEALIARHGDIKAHSFAHESGSECEYAIDAMLSHLAKEVIAARGCFRTPALALTAVRTGPFGAIECAEIIPSRNLPVDSVEIDWRADRRRPSVVMLVKGRELLLEIAHADHIDARKRMAIEALGLPAVEMHLSGADFHNVEKFESILIEGSRNKRWLFNPKSTEIQARLDALADGQRSQQDAQYAAQLERQHQERAAREAARQASEKAHRQQVQQDHLRRLAQAHSGAEEAPARPRRQDARQALHYSLQDGGLTIRNEPHGQVLIVPDSGNEQVLEMFAELGLSYDASLGGYRASAAHLADVLPALQPYVKNVRSV